MVSYTHTHTLTIYLLKSMLSLMKPLSLVTVSHTELNQVSYYFGFLKMNLNLEMLHGSLRIPLWLHAELCLTR